MKCVWTSMDGWMDGSVREMKSVIHQLLIETFNYSFNSILYSSRSKSPVEIHDHTLSFKHTRRLRESPCFEELRCCAIEVRVRVSNRFFFPYRFFDAFKQSFIGFSQPSLARRARVPQHFATLSLQIRYLFFGQKYDFSIY